jgi:hypothetical protein
MKSDEQKPIKVPPRQNLYKVTAGIPGMKRRAYGFKVQASTPREASEKAAMLALAISNHRGITPLDLTNNRAEAWALEATWYGGQLKVA